MLKAKQPRRAFIADLWRWTGLGLAVGGIVLIGRTLGGSPQNDRIKLNAHHLEQLLADGRLLLDGYLIRGPIHRPVAVDRTCTHLGCSLSLDSKTSQLVCPCHHSRFSLEGRPLFGPASLPLARFPLTRKDGEWWIIPRRTLKEGER